ncbi:DNA mismatch repair endonuclease MutL [Halobellus captivus]|uniref:DNA mismatch repair endonuclease MutL n=1 Tax=Halobellus captivus TaxID=2592614 RepID=UPI001EF03AD7|nr:DNA mismatch repair endonuclease MutL [Halobellus captivus]
MTGDEFAGGDQRTEGRPTIRELDDRTIRQIAAGEVVERPASVVKELVENSLDADAERISVAIDAGGTEGVRVRDDGVGMGRGSVQRAVEEHTTSKIEDIADLEAGVGTLGFRGEALHTIGAVSRLTIRTKPRAPRGGGAESDDGDGASDGDSSADGDAAGTELRVEGGEVTDVGPAGCPEGTVVEVDDLFFNTPARKKFLRTTATEFDHVNAVVTHYALANPDVAISLEHDGREVFATEGRGSLRSAVLAVYGREVAESMIDVAYGPSADRAGSTDRPAGDHSTDRPDPTDDQPDTAADESIPVDHVRGLVSHPETNRSTREYLATFVNGRYVTDSVLRQAVLDAYGGQLAGDRYPFAVLFVELPADAVDVNVHPRKMEVRFDDESGVRSAVTDAVRSALLEAGLIRKTAPRGRSAADETEIQPESPSSEVRGGPGHTPQPGSDAGGGDESRSPRESLDASVAESVSETPVGSRSADDEDVSAGGDVPKGGPRTERTEPTTESGGGSTSQSDDSAGVDDPRGPRVDENRGRPRTDESARARTVDPTDDDTWSVSESGRGGRSVGPKSGDVDADTDASDAGSRLPPGFDSLGSDTPGDADGGSTDADESPSEASRPTGIVGPTVQRDLRGEAATLEPRFDSLPSMRILGQLHDTYVVAETESGLVLVDQHAADERVHYERLQRELAGDVVTQALAEPVELELTAREAALFDEFVDALSSLGFRVGRVDDRTVAVESVPAVFAATLDPELVRDVLSAFVSEADGEHGGEETVAAVADDLLADLACYPAVTGNTSLTEGSVVDLLEALDACENPYACPHGRPVVIEIDGDEIGDRFERDYPGHGG